MVERTSFRRLLECLEAFGHAVQAKIGQQVERGMGEHGSLLMVVAGAADIRVQQGRIVRGLR